MRGMMKARNGRIINITSVVGVTGNAGPGQLRRGQGRHHRLHASRWRSEIGSRGITVNCVAPGFIDTDMTRALPEDAREGAAGARSRWAASASRRTSPTRSPSSPARRAAYITGETLHVNGGMYMP